MKHMIIQTQKTVYKVNIDDIYYIQTHPTKAHTVQIVTEKASFNMLQNLSNLDKLKSIDFQERILFLGEEGQYAVKYARRRYREIRQKWLKEGE
ncbi:TPA: LytTR family transcriptional regulator DNA-binding domain-containing protein [Streptococcus pneumoniae]|nr:LytTR family transcriptional regulator DNA-binding domain-containing protein [Streptococcus pneumoniae]